MSTVKLYINDSIARERSSSSLDISMPSAAAEWLELISYAYAMVVARFWIYLRQWFNFVRGGVFVLDVLLRGLAVDIAVVELIIKYPYALGLTVPVVPTMTSGRLFSSGVLLGRYRA